MAQYVDHVDCDFSKIENEIEKVKKSLNEEFESNNSTELEKRKKIFYFVAAGIGLIGIILLIVGIVQIATSIALLVVGIIGLIIAFIAFFIGKIIANKLKMTNMGSINDYFMSRETNFYEDLFEQSFEHAKATHQYKNLFANQQQFNDSLIHKFKYRLRGERPLGIVDKYEIINGTFFNNPIYLSCYLYESETVRIEKDKDGREIRKVQKFFEYIPLLRIKIKHFDGLKLVTTNSRSFPSVPKNKIRFDNMEFRKKINVESTNEVQSLMIFDAVVQEKWVENLKQNSQFLMYVADGYINVIFKGDVSNRTELPFMNIVQDFAKHGNRNTFLNKMNENIYDDFTVLSRILNSVFCIRYFQEEDFSQAN